MSIPVLYYFLLGGRPPAPAPRKPRRRWWRRKAEHQGATLDWSPKADLDRVEREPEELSTEALVREAGELVDYWADLEAQFAAEVHAEFEASWAALEPIQERLTGAARSVVVWSRGMTEAQADEYLARFVSGKELTGEYPVVRELVAS